MSKLVGNGDLEILAFTNKQLFYDWMLDNHAVQPGLWLRMYKKASGVQTIVWAEAVEVCLCFGWIDGIANRYDDESYLQRLTPRRKRSTWSKINCDTSERLISEGLMHQAGLTQIEAAKLDGRWEAAYDSPKNMKIPEDFLTAVSAYPEALKNFETLKKTSLYSIGYSLANAKREETRTRRIEKFVDKLKRGESI